MAENSTIDKHKVWMIIGIVIVVLGLGFLLLYSPGEGKVGKAYQLVPAGKVSPPMAYWSMDNLGTNLKYSNADVDFVDDVDDFVDDVDDFVDDADNSVMILQSDNSDKQMILYQIVNDVHTNVYTPATAKTNFFTSNTQDGVVGDALDLNNNRYLKTTHGGSEAFNPARKISLEFWIKARSAQNVGADSSTTGVYIPLIYAGKGTGNPGRAYSVWLQNIEGTKSNTDAYGIHITTADVSDAYSTASTNEILLPNVWYHVVAVIDRSEDVGKAKIYVNGVEQSSFDVTKQDMIPLSTSNLLEKYLYIGSSSETSYGFFNGLLDEVAFYPDVALTAEEVDRLAHSGRSTTDLAVSECYPKEIIGYWKGEGNVINSVGGVSGNVGEFVERDTTSVHYVDGQIGRAFNFNNDSYIKVNDPDNIFKASDTGLSVEHWFKTDTHPVGSTPFMVYKRYGDTWKYVYGTLMGYDCGIQFKGCTTANPTSCDGAANARNIDSSDGWCDGQWHHVVGTFKPNKEDGIVSIYVDGVLKDSQTIVRGKTLWSSQGEPLFIGAWAKQDAIDGNSALFNGSIDEVSIYDRALSAEEVAKLYAFERDNEMLDDDCTENSACTTSDGAKGSYTWSDDYTNGNLESLPLAADRIACCLPNQCVANNQCFDYGKNGIYTDGGVPLNYDINCGSNGWDLCVASSVNTLNDDKNYKCQVDNKVYKWMSLSECTPVEATECSAGVSCPSGEVVAATCTGTCTDGVCGTSGTSLLGDTDGSGCVDFTEVMASITSYYSDTLGFDDIMTIISNYYTEGC